MGRTLALICVTAFVLAAGLSGSAGPVLPMQETTPEQLFFMGLDGSPKTLGVFEWIDGRLERVWFDTDQTIGAASNGMTLADADGDGLVEALIVRGPSETSQFVEIWKYDGASGYHRVWTGAPAATNLGSIGGVADLDNDGQPEFLRTTGTAEQVWGYKSPGNWELEADVTIGPCSTGPNPVRFVRAAGDMDGNGIPEFFVQCAGGAGTPVKGKPSPPPTTTSIVHLLEWDIVSKSYIELGHWTIASGYYYMDDCECRGDLDADGKVDCIFSGNDDMMSHVVSFKNGTWRMYDSPVAPSYVASCKAGDFNGDGLLEYYDYAETSAAVAGSKKDRIPANTNVTLRFFHFEEGAIAPWGNISNMNATAHRVSSTMSGDINGDGFDEVGLVMNRAQPYDYAFFSRAGGQWAEVARIPGIATSAATGRWGKMR